MGDLKYRLTVVQGDQEVFEAGILLRPEDAETRIEIPTGSLLGASKFCEIRLIKIEPGPEDPVEGEDEKPE